LYALFGRLILPIDSAEMCLPLEISLFSPFCIRDEFKAFDFLNLIAVMPLLLS
jgi:hypothetical protein